MYRNQRSRGGGKNPEVTAEQVWRVMNESCAKRQQRRSSEAKVLSVIRYHQQRNAAATRTHKNRSQARKKLC
jgi:hypothetical protein